MRELILDGRFFGRRVDRELDRREDPEKNLEYPSARIRAEGMRTLPPPVCCGQSECSSMQSTPAACPLRAGGSGHALQPRA